MRPVESIGSVIEHGLRRVRAGRGGSRKISPYRVTGVTGWGADHQEDELVAVTYGGHLDDRFSSRRYGLIDRYHGLLLLLGVPPIPLCTC